jgi:carbonic anhydrase
MTNETFATAITCIDGRVQRPVSDWIKLHTGVHHVDLITEPGPDKVFTEGPAKLVDDVMRRVSFSVRHHFSEFVALVGHHQCAANDASREEHIEQILEGIRLIPRYERHVRLLGLYLNEWGSIELLYETEVAPPIRSFL